MLTAIDRRGAWLFDSDFRVMPLRLVSLTAQLISTFKERQNGHQGK